MEPDRYEAEWAYLPCFDDLGKNLKQILYAVSPGCSGCMKVHHLGGSEEIMPDGEKFIVRREDSMR